MTLRLTARDRRTMAGKWCVLNVQVAFQMAEGVQTLPEDTAREIKAIGEALAEVAGEQLEDALPPEIVPAQEALGAVSLGYATPESAALFEKWSQLNREDDADVP